MSTAHKLDEKIRTKDVIIDEQLNFNALLLSESTLTGLHNAGFKKPSPIQLKAIPIGKCGFDLIVKSKSGTGKTLVFAIIALEMLSIPKKSLQVLILVPTREIAVQIQDVIQTLGCEYKGLKVASFIGGLPLENDIKNLCNCQIAVGTPGRVKHLIKLGNLNTSSVKLLVLDEADKLMAEDFEDSINEIYNKLPVAKQTIALSATYPDELNKYLDKFTSAATHVSPDTDTPLLLGLKQFVSVVKCNLNVIHQMNIKTEELLQILSKVSFTQCLIFSNYQTRAESISNTLNRKGWNSTYISGAQNQKERLEAVSSLKEFKCRIFLSTDLTSRGIDASNVDLVINYDVPYDASTYLHRMGRAGRYGSHGLCITLAALGNELTDLQFLLGSIGGTLLSVPKLPPSEDIPPNLWNCDTNKFDLIHGIIDTNGKSDVHSKIKTDLTQSMNELKRRKAKCETKLSTRNDKNENKLEIVKAESTKENEQDITQDSNKENSMNIDTVQNLLDLNKKNEERIECKFSSADSHSLLTSLACGNKLNSESFDLQKEETFGNLLSQLTSESHLSKIESKKRKRNNETSQYSESFHHSNIMNKSACSNEPDIRSNLGYETELHIPKKVICNSTITVNKNIALLNITKLLFGNYDMEKVSKDIFQSVDVYISLMNACDDANLGVYNKLLESRTLYDVIHLMQTGQIMYNEKNIERTGIDGIDNTEHVCDSVSQSESPQPVFMDDTVGDVMENIFKLGFDYAINSDAPNWVDVLGDKFKEQIDLNEVDQIEDQEETHDQISYLNSDFTLSTHKTENKSKRPNRNKYSGQVDTSRANSQYHGRYHDNCVDTYNSCQSTAENQMYLDYQHYPGLYSEYEYSSNAHFDSCFEYYNKDLQEQALNFQDTSSFDRWFSQWQLQLQGVRDYVQQNIYIQEMNKYTISRK